jgi:hypothetical protein
VSITITYSTLDHRYFMRRTKNEIIRRIEELSGRPCSIGERQNLMTWTKDALASYAMGLVRELPPPPDPVDTLVQVIVTELRRQSEAQGPTPYYHLEPDWKAVMDGVFDLRQLAQAILKSGVLPL